MGSRDSRHIRLRASRGKTVPESELRIDGHRRNLDEMVSDHQAAERPVCLFFALSFATRTRSSDGKANADTDVHRLAAVNFLLGCVGLVQVSRIFAYNQSQKGKSAVATAKEGAEDMGKAAVGAVEQGTKKLKSAAS